MLTEFAKSILLFVVLTGVALAESSSLKIAYFEADASPQLVVRCTTTPRVKFSCLYPHVALWCWVTNDRLCCARSMGSESVTRRTPIGVRRLRKPPGQRRTESRSTRSINMMPPDATLRPRRSWPSMVWPAANMITILRDGRCLASPRRFESHLTILNR